MTEELVFAGFGGQGIILSGMIVCLAAMKEGKQVSHIPSYGAEMRGGTANCMVVVSDEPIGSPLVPHPSVCVVMNQPSLTKFEPAVKPGGLLIWNSSLVAAAPTRADIRCVAVPANALAEEQGSGRAANMIVLGLLARLKPEIAALDSIAAGVGQAISARNRDLHEINLRCLKKGYSLS